MRGETANEIYHKLPAERTAAWVENSGNNLWTKRYLLLALTFAHCDCRCLRHRNREDQLDMIRTSFISTSKDIRDISLALAALRSCCIAHVLPPHIPLLSAQCQRSALRDQLSKIDNGRTCIELEDLQFERMVEGRSQGQGSSAKNRCQCPVQSCSKDTSLYSCDTSVLWSPESCVLLKSPS